MSSPSPTPAAPVPAAPVPPAPSAEVEEPRSGGSAWSRPRTLFYIAQAAALLGVLVPFLRHNNLLEWDFPGHYAAVWYQQKFLFPWPWGWNPFFYCGYPQGIFYPPMAHYGAALLAFVVGIGPAMKILVAASVLALPAAFYRLGRRAGLDELQASVAAAWTTGLLFVSGEILGTLTLGADLRSMINVGLFASTVSLPLLVGFMATFPGRSDGSGWRLPALLWGLLILVHPLAALVGAIYAAAWVAAHLGAAGWWRMPLRTLVVGTLLGCLWLVPFAAYRAGMNPEYTPSQWSPPVLLIVFNGTVLAASALARRPLRPLALFFLLLGEFVLVASLVRMELQLSRLTVFLLLMLPILLVAWIRSRALLVGVALLAGVVALVGYRHGGVSPRGVPDFAVPDFGAVPGRILSVAAPSHVPSFHVHHDLVPLRTGNLGQMGLFIEASLNGRFLGDLLRALDPDAHVWGTPTESVPKHLLGAAYPRYVLDRLRLFDVRHVYTDLRLEDVLGAEAIQSSRLVNRQALRVPPTGGALEDLRRRYHSDGRTVDFFLYTLRGGALAEPLPYVPGVPGTDWKLTTIRWFVEARGVPVFTDRPVPAGVRAALPTESVAVVEHRPGRLRMHIRADADVPVLVKIGYFPGWRLTIDGRAAPLYRAAPNLTLLFGHGEAILEYRRSWPEYAGLALCLGGIGLLVGRRRVSGA